MFDEKNGLSIDCFWFTIGPHIQLKEAASAYSKVLLFAESELDRTLAQNRSNAAISSFKDWALAQN